MQDEVERQQIRRLVTDDLALADALEVALTRADVSVPAPLRELLSAARRNGLAIIHTREGHRPDLSDAPRAKVERGAPSMRIGDKGPMGRILIRGEAGHDIIPELYPVNGEPVIDKPGKGAFYQTDLDLMLRNRGIETLLVTGVTTEVCVHTTVREANDRGYRAIVRRRLLRLLLPRVSRGGLEDDRRPGRHLRLGRPVGERDRRNQIGETRKDTGVRRWRRNRQRDRRSGCRATGTPSSASAPTSSSTCWC